MLNDFCIVEWGAECKGAGEADRGGGERLPDGYLGQLPDDEWHHFQGPTASTASDADKNWLEQDCQLQHRQRAEESVTALFLSHVNLVTFNNLIYSILFFISGCDRLLDCLLPRGHWQLLDFNVMGGGGLLLKSIMLMPWLAATVVYKVHNSVQLILTLFSLCQHYSWFFLLVFYHFFFYN